MFNKTFTITLFNFSIETHFLLISVTSGLISTEKESGFLVTLAILDNLKF